MAAAVETELTEAQRYIKEHGPAPRAVPELDEVSPGAEIKRIVASAIDATSAP